MSLKIESYKCDNIVFSNELLKRKRKHNEIGWRLNLFKTHLENVTKSAGDPSLFKKCPENVPKSLGEKISTNHA